MSVDGWAAMLEMLRSPWLIALALAATTLLFEDLAIAFGVALAAQGAISWPLSIVAVGGGIALGDLGLYAAGLGATRVRWMGRWAPTQGSRSAGVRERLARGLGSAVLLARVIPGLRLVTYTACGFLRLPFGRFTAWVVLAVTLWTLALYAASLAAGAALAHALGLPLPVAVALPLVGVALALPALRWWRGRQSTRSAPGGKASL